VKPSGVLDSVVTEDGTELVLHCRNGVYTIRVDGYELMSSRAHGSEEALARHGCAHLATRPGSRVLVGGLGMGFTLRAALNLLPESAEVVTAEVFPAVVEWCRGPLAHLAGGTLADRRVRVVTDDVATVLESDEVLYDTILLDVDNGPKALTLSSNRRLYSPAGLERLHDKLVEDGALAVWSAFPDDDFARRLERCGFEVRTEAAAARADVEGPDHTIFVALKLRRA
jgi:spermidine synthase